MENFIFCAVHNLKNFRNIPEQPVTKDVDPHNSTEITMISSKTKDTTTNPSSGITTDITVKSTPISNNSYDLVHKTTTSENPSYTRKSNESGYMNKRKRYSFLIGDNILEQTDNFLLTNSISHQFIIKARVYPARKR